MASKAFKPAMAVAVVAAAVMLAYFLLSDNGRPAGHIESTGVVEAAEAELSSKIAGRISWLCCEEGDAIEAGAVAVRLEAAELASRLLEGKAGAAAAAEELEEARIASESAAVQKEAAASALDAARAEAQRAAALEKEAGENLKRAEGLFEGGYISRREIDAARASYESNLALLEAARARARSGEADLRSAGVAMRGAKARVATAGARKEAAEAQVKVLASQLRDTEIASPLSGVVSYKAYEAGEYVTPGAAVYTVYAPSALWARVDIEETRVQDVRLGAEARITPSGGGRSFSGTVTEVGELGGFATQRDVTRGRSDIKTFRVRVRAEDSEGRLKPGMTVNVRIFTGEGEVGGDRDY